MVQAWAHYGPYLFLQAINNQSNKIKANSFSLLSLNLSAHPPTHTKSPKTLLKKKKNKKKERRKKEEEGEEEEGGSSS